MAKSSEIRSSRKAVILGRAAGWLIRVWALTLRFKVDDRCGLTRPENLDRRFIYCLWHDSVFVMPPAWIRGARWKRPAVVLTSASHDGAMLASAMKVFGIGAVRGSTSRRAVGALVAMRHALRNGTDACITPDGPRGPARHLQGGVVRLAQTERAPLIIVEAAYQSVWRLKSWDRFQIPKPFSKVCVTFYPPLAVPPDLSEDEFEVWRQRLEDVMRQGGGPDSPAAGDDFFSTR